LKKRGLVTMVAVLIMIGESGNKNGEFISLLLSCNGIKLRVYV
jgi:hypothetical protein